MPTAPSDGEFIFWINHFQAKAHANATAHGFWEEPVEQGTRIALQHSELSELLEAIRKGNPESEKIPGFSHAEEEYADLVIRILDDCEYNGYRLGEAIIAKMQYNASRPYKHGKGF